MGMRVNGVRNPYEIYQSQSVSNVSRLSRAEEKKDMVALSVQAKDYQTAARALRETPDVRESKVADIQNKIEAGEYNISSKAVAGKILGLEPIPK